LVAPLRLPNHSTAGNDWQAAQNQHGNASIGNNGGYVSA
jgi:hypothetical protein